MAWRVRSTPEFEEWYDALTDDERGHVIAAVDLLKEFGPHLRFPFCSGIARSRHRHMRELRIQHRGSPYRVLYAFDPERTAVLLLGGNKKGEDRWYDVHVPRADKLYDRYLLDTANGKE